VCDAIFSLFKKSLFIHTQLRLREAEYTDERPVSLFIGTWNVNGKPPGAAPLQAWLVVEGVLPDIVVCGLQEMDQSTSTLVFNSETAKAEPWIALIGAALAQLGTYIMRVKQQLGGVLQLLWVRKEMLPRVRDVQEHSKSTGFGGILGEWK
jgi:hypothetical protein